LFLGGFAFPKMVLPPYLCDSSRSLLMSASKFELGVKLSSAFLEISDNFRIASILSLFPILARLIALCRVSIVSYICTGTGKGCPSFPP
jgi:hypothetical protein